MMPKPITIAGFTYANKSDFDNAIKDYTSAVRLEPNYAEAYNGRGANYANKRDFDNAIRDYNIAIKLKPECAGFYYNRGQCLQGKKTILIML